ncbi:MAG: N-acetyl-gamma-glutamyl-phosphate reductase [Candidatus Omnitrophica bacterium]|nr:N-acetyl-gamma-glutamyl-phosphate reductase [Candidatus Omnitrophota bacterium]
MLNVGIVGAAGYTAETLIDILLNHPNVKLVYASRKTAQGSTLQEIFPKFKGRINLPCGVTDLKLINDKCELVFLTLPHTASMEIAPKLIKLGKRVIDLSADYRLSDEKVYEKHYQVKHLDKPNLRLAVYGLPELYRNKIKQAKLIANPGCYPTAAILALAPVISLGVADLKSAIIDAKSGVTGAGKKLVEGFLFSEVNEDFKAYKVNAHQHAPEINQILSSLSGGKASVTFVPHLLPINRGILETIYIKKFRGVKSKDLVGLYNKFYKDEPFVRIKEEGSFPSIKDVAGTNFCDIGIKDCGEMIIIIAAIDNLLKGASGQAVQNMNIMYKYPESLGLL